MDYQGASVCRTLNLRLMRLKETVVTATHTHSNAPDIPRSTLNHASNESLQIAPLVGLDV